MDLASDIFRTLGDPTRRSLFERLAREGELTVGALREASDVSQPAVSQHLAVLKQAGLVSERRDGRYVRYRADPEGLKPMLDWLGFYSSFWAERFDRLEKLLKEMDQ
jgi:DNA-binding transcriptional ArsR family regulator